MGKVCGNPWGNPIEIIAIGLNPGGSPDTGTSWGKSTVWFQNFSCKQWKKSFRFSFRFFTFVSQVMYNVRFEKLWNQIRTKSTRMARQCTLRYNIHTRYIHGIAWPFLLCFPFCIKNSEAASQSSVNGRGRVSFGVVKMFGKCVEVLEFEEIWERFESCLAKFFCRKCIDSAETVRMSSLLWCWPSRR